MDAHHHNDVDFEATSQHHTLGRGPTQAAPGNHVHSLTGDLLRTYATLGKGWIPADGSAVSRTTYKALFTLLGTTYGVGDGVTTFNVPNFAPSTGAVMWIKT